MSHLRERELRGLNEAQRVETAGLHLLMITSLQLGLTTTSPPDSSLCNRPLWSRLAMICLIAFSGEFLELTLEAMARVTVSRLLPGFSNRKSVTN